MHAQFSLAAEPLFNVLCSSVCIMIVPHLKGDFEPCEVIFGCLTKNNIRAPAPILFSSIMSLLTTDCTVCLCECVCGVYFEYQNIHSSSKGRAVLQGTVIWAGALKFKGPFQC